MHKLRIVVVTQGLSFLPLQLEKENVVGVCESAPRVWRASMHSQFRRFAREVLARWLGHSTLRQHARARRVPYFWVHRDNEPEFVNWIKDLQPDLVIVYSMSQLLSPSALAVPRLGILNIHPSLLPSYRGPNPWFWLYRDGVHQSGVSLHWLDKGEDTGPIAAQAKFDIPLGQSLERTMELCQAAAGELLHDLLARLEQGELVAKPQDRTSATVRAKNPDANDIQNLSRWSEWETTHAYHFLCGMANQYPGLLKGGQPAPHYTVTGYSLDASFESSGQCQGRSVVCRDGRVFYMADEVSRASRWTAPFRGL